MDQSEYRKKIYNCENAIDECKCTIKDCEEKKHQLDVLRKKLEVLLSTLERSKDKGQKSVNKLKNALTIGRRVFRGNFFNTIRKAFGDSKYKIARNELINNIEMVNQKVQDVDAIIEAKKKEIYELTQTINNCRAEIRAIDAKERAQ